jgi:hypothetical protein
MSGKQVHLSPDALFQEIGGEGVILDLASSTYYGFDEVGVRFWQLLQDDADLAAACDALEGEFEVGREQLEKDLDQLIAQFVDAGLARVE